MVVERQLGEPIAQCVSKQIDIRRCEPPTRKMGGHGERPGQVPDVRDQRASRIDDVHMRIKDSRRGRCQRAAPLERRVRDRLA